MGRLNQVIAVVAPKKAKVEGVKTILYHKIQKPALFDGISKTYRPKDEENGDKLPPESKSVQVTVNEMINEFGAALVELLDTVATQDYANCTAAADVKVNGAVILPKVPVTHLLFLEKQLTDVSTFVGKLPTLDPAEEWKFNEAAGYYGTPPSETHRTKKVPIAFVKYAATDQHPAQVDTLQQDVLDGYWRTTKFSGAIPAKRKQELEERVRALKEAVVQAREEANSVEVKPVAEGRVLLDFIFKESVTV